MGDQYEQIPGALIGTTQQSGGGYMNPPPAVDASQYPTTPPTTPSGAQTSAAPVTLATLPKGMPSAPSARIGCCDAKTMVLVSASLLLISELVTIGWYSMEEKYIFVAFSGINAVLCLLLYINAFGLRSAPFHIVIGTLMLIANLAKAGYLIYDIVAAGDYTSGETIMETNVAAERLHKRCPPFETYLMALVVIVGMVQMYRVQAFRDTYGALAAVTGSAAGSDTKSDIEAANNVITNVSKKKGKKKKNKNKKTTTIE